MLSFSFPCLLQMHKYNMNHDCVYNRIMVFTSNIFQTILLRRKSNKKSPLFTRNKSNSNSKNKMMDNHQWSREVTVMKVSSGHGIVKPPIGWSNPNSSSALLRRAWNEGWLKYEIGTTYLFFWLSPTYTARNPFGAAEVALLLVAAPRIFFAPNRLLTKAISRLVFFESLNPFEASEDVMKRFKLLDV